MQRALILPFPRPCVGKVPLPRQAHPYLKGTSKKTGSSLLGGKCPLY